jgi:hypothetical protein
MKEDIFKLVAVNKNTVKEFGIWLFDKLNRDKELYNKLAKSGNYVKIPYLVQYLESLDIPMLEAMCYYQYKLTSNVGLIDLLIFTILMEFKRIEEKRETNYILF